MSTFDRPSWMKLPPLAAGQRLDRATFHERYAAMPPKTRAELIGGIVHMPSPMSSDHGDENGPVFIWLDYYAENTPGIRSNLGSSLLLDDLGEPQADVSLRVLPEYAGQVRHEGGYIVGAPELVVEIARSSRKTDLGEKKADYERAGVREYIVVELEPDRIHWFIRRGDRFETLPPAPTGCSVGGLSWALARSRGTLRRRSRRLRAVVDQGLATPEHADFVARLSAAREANP